MSSAQYQQPSMHLPYIGLSNAFPKGLAEALEGEGDPAFYAMRLAINSGDTSSMQCILAGGMNVNYRNSIGHTLLMGAISRGAVEPVRCLLECGADINLCAKSGAGPLNVAGFLAVPDIFRCLIEAKPKSLETRCIDGETPLCRAASSNHAEVVGLLLEAGAAQDTPLHSALAHAARADSVEAMELLLAHGSALIPNPPLLAPLTEAGKTGSVRALRLLIQWGADISHQEPPWGFSALTAAVYNDHAPAVMLLLESGSDPAMRANDGRDAIGIAYERKAWNALAVLLAWQTQGRLQISVAATNKGSAVAGRL
jgi:ankyrin repeat protein